VTRPVLVHALCLAILFLTGWAGAEVKPELVSVQLDSSHASVDTTAHLHMGRLIGVTGLSSVSFIGSYVFVFQSSWWSGPRYDFHYANDFDYAKNVDKLGHFYGGIMLGEGFYDGFRWSGVSEFKSHLLAGSMASLTMVGVDIKDGFSYWGFSPWDVIAGSLGGFYPMAKRYVPGFQFVDYKFSYWQNSSAYWDQVEDKGEDGGGVFTDDYSNQTHWLSLRVNDILPRAAADYWPDWLTMAVGVSVQDTIFKKENPSDPGYPWPPHGKREYYVGLDYDLKAIFHPKSELGKRILTYMNYIKLPAPGYRFYPDRKFYWIYPIKF